MRNLENSDWQASEPQMFWAEIAPTEHVVQIYDSDEIFLDQLESFAVSGFKKGDCVVIIATRAHIDHLNHRLAKAGVNINALTADEQYIALEVEETLSKFMVNGWPDAKLFNETINQVVKCARQKNRPLRAFGEMVAVLWANGHSGATVHLENLWNRFCETEAFCLFCAYPKTGFTQDVTSSMHNICCAHSKMISGEHRSKLQIFYKPVLKSAS